MYSGWSNEGQHFFIRIYTSFYSFKRSWSFCGLWDRRIGGDKTHCHIDPYLLLLTIAQCVIFKAHLALLLLLDQGCSTGGLVWATGPTGTLSVTASWLWLWPSLSPTLSTGGSSSQRGVLTDCKLALTLAFTVTNCLNWRQQPSVGCSHWL